MRVADPELLLHLLLQHALWVGHHLGGQRHRAAQRVDLAALARSLRGVPVLVSADRYLAGCLAERRFGCTVHLLDDGFQHFAVHRDVDLVLVSRSAESFAARSSSREWR